jgi:serine/threonine protein kinase
VTLHAIAGRFQPLEPARAGAPQRVRDLQTAQSVVLRSVVLASDDAIEWVGRAHAAKGIFHPSLVTLFEVLRDGDRLLLAYEFVPAQTVAQFTGGLPLNPRRAAEILIELGDAVAELHARGVVHGGIAPRTVLITMKGKAKLDRVGDPSVGDVRNAEPAHDLAALGELLHGIAAASSKTPSTLHGLDRVIEKARSGALDSAATFAALLRGLVS